MARPVYQYQPFNQNPDKALGILLPLNKPGNSRAYDANYASGSSDGGGVFVSSYSTLEQSVSNLKMLLLTRLGERIMQPGFGTTIQSTLFENLGSGTRQALDDSITGALERWLPYMILEELDIFENRVQGNLLIRMSINVTNVGANVVINMLTDEDNITIVEEADIVTDSEGNLFTPGTPALNSGTDQDFVPTSTTFNTFGTSY